MARATPRPSLGTLRWRLTAWYVGTFCVMLALLGGGLFLVVRGQVAAQLDDSLRDATRELERAARIREMEAGSGTHVVDAIDELHIPDRALFLLDTAGRPVKPATADEWVRAAARAAARTGSADRTRELDEEEHSLQLHAERFALASGAPLVAIAVADQVELEDRYASLIAAFSGAAAVALLLVGAGSWILVRQSTLPIERTIAYMRRFMADAAHELRTPLTVLRTRAEVALQQPRETPAYVSALRGIEVESSRLGRIVDDLLTLARADAGERPIERARVFLDDVAIDAATAARVVAGARGVALSVGEFEEAVVDGDAVLLRRLVMILLDNAVKFTPPGGRVTVRVGAPAGHPELVVEDTGVGIAPAQLPHVFDRFWRGDPARSRAPAGTEPEGAGLGLSIARWIVAAHEGAIDVASTVGAGTTVTVRLPPAVPVPDAMPGR